MTLTVANNSVVGARARFAVRALPGLSDIAFLLPLFFVFGAGGGASALLTDSDTGWHLRNGEWIIDHGGVPFTDPFSFTMFGRPWFAWEWLWDAAFGLAHRLVGLPGVVWLNVALLCGTSALLFRICRRACGNDVLAFGVTIAATITSSIHWHARPHLVSWPLLLITVALIEEARKGRTRALFWMPPVVVLWANLHGSFFLAIAALVVYAFGEVAEGVITSGTRDAWKRAWPLLACAAACAAATLCNPYGWALDQHVVAYLKDAKQLDIISEYQSPTFHHPLALLFEAGLFMGWLAVAWHAAKLRFGAALHLAMWSHLALLARRNVPLFVFVAAPLISIFLNEACEALAGSGAAAWLRRSARAIADAGLEFRPIERIERFWLPSAVSIVLLGLLMLRAPAASGALAVRFDPKLFPERALPTLRAQLPARIFTHDQWGGFLIYRMYPAVPVFVDGRSDLYGAEFSREWLQVVNAGYLWEQNLQKYEIDTVLAEAGGPLAEVLKLSPHWRLVYDDHQALIFRLSPGMNARGIAERSKRFSTAAIAGEQR